MNHVKNIYGNEAAGQQRDVEESMGEATRKEEQCHKVGVKDL